MKPTAPDSAQGAGLRPGLRGWLIVFCISVVFSLARPIIITSGIFAPILQHGTWDYHMHFVPSIDPYSHSRVFLLMSLSWGILSALLLLIFLILLVMRSRIFPIYFLILAACSLTFVLTDAVVTKLIWPGAALPAFLDVPALVNVAIFCLAWIPYALKAKRIAMTFVR
jgi:Protein of unknown function (DUF2569)